MHSSASSSERAPLPIRKSQFLDCNEIIRYAMARTVAVHRLRQLLHSSQEDGLGNALQLVCNSYEGFTSGQAFHHGSRSANLLQWHGFATVKPGISLKYYKPTTPGMRGRVITTRENLWRGGPFKPLTEGVIRTGGRNNSGKITSWHRGGGAKRLYRCIDFVRSGSQGPGVVERLEYDPNRSAHIALVRHPEVMEKQNQASRQAMFSYMLAPQSIKPGDSISYGPGVPIRTGNTLPLSSIPLGAAIHNVELIPGRGGQMARSAGTSCTLISRGTGDDAYAVIKLPSGEQRSVLARCQATIGSLSNQQHRNRKIGKAGAKRWMGRRPVVRGVAMNSVDHPHGGGRGKSKGRISQSPWGKQTKGMKTRKPRNITDRFIHLSRHKIKSIAAEKRK